MKLPKEFDCVEMKNDIQRRLHERRKSMTHAEELKDIELRLASSQSPLAAWWRNSPKKAVTFDSLNAMAK